MEKTIKIISNISALLGIILFIFPLLSTKQIHLAWWQWTFIAMSLSIIFCYIMYEIFSGPNKYRNPDDIKKYMHKWINQPGRVVIFTRDMSWADDNVTKNHLREKARNNELIIFHPKMIRLTTDLKTLGAEIFEYSNLNFVPKSRFTFIRYNTTSSKVAIGQTDKDHIHYIEEYTHGDMQYFLAEDLINLIKALN